MISFTGQVNDYIDLGSLGGAVQDLVAELSLINTRGKSLALKGSQHHAGTR